MAQAIRDAVVRSVRYWSGHAVMLLGRLLAWLGIPVSKYHDWQRRLGRENEHNAQTPRRHWLKSWERATILAYQEKHPDEGYRRLAHMARASVPTRR